MLDCLLNVLIMHLKWRPVRRDRLKVLLVACCTEESWSGARVRTDQFSCVQQQTAFDYFVRRTTPFSKSSFLKLHLVF